MAESLTRQESGSVVTPEDLAEQLAALQQIAGIGFWTWDVPTNRVRWSDELFRIYGVSPTSFKASFEGFLSLVHPEDRDLCVRMVQGALASGSPFGFEHRINRPDEAVRTLQARGLCAKDEQGRVVRIFGTATDVTEIRAAEVKAKEAERLAALDLFRSEFINKAAHELRTPLLPIRVQTHILGVLLGTKADPREQKALATLGRNLDRLNDLIDDLLEAARLQANRLRLERRPFDMNALLDEAAENFQPVANQLGLRLRWQPRHGMAVDADAQKMLQVVHNLLGNAMKYTPPGGTITLSVERQGEQVRVAVADTGPGLEPPELAGLFKPFSQGSAGKQSKAPSTGLGLYISKGIVEAHGGRIWAESAGKGQGARFMVELPLTHKAPEPVHVATRTPNWWRDAPEDAQAQRFRDLI